MSAQLLSSSSSRDQSQILIRTSIAKIRIEISRLKQIQESETVINLINLTLEYLQPWLDLFPNAAGQLNMELAQQYFYQRQYEENMTQKEKLLY